LTIFHLELMFQCKVLLSAGSDLRAALDDVGDPQAVWLASDGLLSPSDRVWLALQQLLVAGGNISRLMWGAGGERGNQRAALRASVGVGGGSSFFDPKVRGYFEHADEKIEAWLSKNPTSTYVGRTIGADTVQVVGETPGQRMHQYDPATGIVSFLGVSASVPDLMREAGEILVRLREELAKWPQAAAS
jgi:hypothetical protein